MSAARALRRAILAASLLPLLAGCRGGRGESATLPGSGDPAAAESAATPESADPRDAPAEGLELIDVEDLRARLRFFASDLLEGREAGTRGDRLAAAYLASELASLGVEPVGPDSSYLHRFPLPGGADSSQNVAGLIRGADPELARQIVAVGAHFDHVGIGAPVAGDSIYNGADDDGSGTVAVLELAEALARGPRPARSVLVVFHGAEEAGLLGSFAFTLSPPVPRDSIVAQLNLDMVGRNAPDSLFVIGSGRISSELDAIVRRQAEAEGLHLDYTYDAPEHPERLYYRSDHYSYAQYGIPVAFFFAGLHDDYHGPGDEVSKIDFGKIENVAELVYRVVWEVASRPDRLPRDRAG